MIHSNVWGPSLVSTLYGICWFVTFIDDCTHMTWLYLMKNKDEIFSLFKMFHAMVHTQFACKIQILRIDNNREYDNQLFH